MIDIFLNNINAFLDNYGSFKSVNRYKLKFKSKPWITPGLKKSVLVEKKKFLTDFIKKKDNNIKAELYPKYKSYKNLLSSVLKKSK